MGTTSNYSWPYPESSDYVADGATAIENLADAIDTTVFSGLSVVQLKGQSFNTTLATTSTEVDTGNTITITPRSASNKILIVAFNQWYIPASGTGILFRIKRNTTTLTANGCGVDANNANGTYSMGYLDSPATTSATTYKTTYVSTSTNIVYINNSARYSFLLVAEVSP